MLYPAGGKNRRAKLGSLFFAVLSYHVNVLIRFKLKKHFGLLKKAKKKDINIISDLLIGFSNKDYWRKQDAFLGPYSTYGCKAHDGRLNDWGIKALNFYNSKAAEELLQEKVEKTLMHGIRLDAVWQYFEPVIKHNYPDNKDFEIVPADKVNDKFIRVIENVINEHGIPKELIISENLSPSGNVYSKLKNIGFPQLSVAHFNESIQDSPADNWQALSTLDTPSINTFTNGNKYKQKILWSRLFYGPVNWERGPNKILTTVFDVLGMNETYNKADSQDCSNWKMRLPEDFDAFYFKQVKNDNALNLPEILKTSLEWKNKGSQALKNKLQMFADILKEDGPMTEKEANEFFAKTAEEEASGILKKVS